jgi:hypothetical protein
MLAKKDKQSLIKFVTLMEGKAEHKRAYRERTMMVHFQRAWNQVNKINQNVRTKDSMADKIQMESTHETRVRTKGEVRRRFNAKPCSETSDRICKRTTLTD